jgi:geranylgeranyl diphosphate synthase type I
MLKINHDLTQTLLVAIEKELRQTITRIDGPGCSHLHYMLAYHLGWEGEGAGPEASGKRIRPVLVLLTCAAAGGAWQAALPAAAAVELVHNFSLIHDDIEDNSPTRRSRPTLWKLWGIPQAINSGDALFTLAHLELGRLRETRPAEVTLQAAELFEQACLQLTQGQYLDLAYEARTDLFLDDYWPMIRGKTAALLAAGTELGSLIAGVQEERRSAFRRFGEHLGLAFQTQDDLLGIWGDAALIGKSTASDLLTGKKSLPVLYGLSQKGKFAQRWYRGNIQPEEIGSLAAQLEAEGGRDYTRRAAEDETEQASQALEEAQPRGEAGEALTALAHQLLHRQA